MTPAARSSKGGCRGSPLFCVSATAGEPSGQVLLAHPDTPTWSVPKEQQTQSHYYFALIYLNIDMQNLLTVL